MPSCYPWKQNAFAISPLGSFNINVCERWWGYLGIGDFYALEMQDENTAKSLYGTLIKVILV